MRARDIVEFTAVALLTIIVETTPQPLLTGPRKLEKQKRTYYAVKTAYHLLSSECTCFDPDGKIYFHSSNSG